MHIFLACEVSLQRRKDKILRISQVIENKGFA